MITDWRLAEALAIERTQGPDADAFVGERIVALSLSGDIAGAKRFVAIATKLDELRGGTIQ